jgi:hypothetical protein
MPISEAPIVSNHSATQVIISERTIGVDEAEFIRGENTKMNTAIAWN